MLVIDAAAFEEDFDPEKREEDFEGEMDPAGFLQSIHKLINMARRESATLVVFGHDFHQWNTLKKAPEFYD